ncbi:MAG: SusC/RagA family TonB-linked outer membrane protein, partial [Dysgonamonadaceae bacterium]|nr:SusC/RagA family TonB-linked outer membrane protein [Dysgonamonadaceae bacterium]
MKQLTRKICLLSALLLYSLAGAFAQEKILVRGTVISATDKLSLIGASVVEINKDERTVASAVTNIDGNFSIHISDTKNRLAFTYIGYKRKEVVIGNKTNFQIELIEDNALSEVVVTATPKRTVGAIPIAERDISMAVSRIDISELGDLHATSIDEMIQGRLAGVDIVANAGDPGSGMSIRIRGTTSLTGDAQPLIVVDGIPLETEIGADFDFSTATEEEFSQLLNIAPTDIQEVAVLKDAAATAVWGSKAANGVLQITTVRGSVSPPRISFRSTSSYKPKAVQLPTLSGNEYVTMLLESHLNAGSILDPLRYPQFSYDPNNPEYYYNYSQNTDWVDAVSQDVLAQEYNLSVRGGSAKVRYSFSAGYYDDNGNTIETNFNRLNTRMNLDYFVSDKLSFSADMAYTSSKTKKNYVPNSSSESADVRAHAYTKMPNQSIFYYNELGELTPQYYTPVNNPQGTYPNVFNPVAMARDGRYDIGSESVAPRLSLQYRPNTTWRYTADVSFQIINTKKKKFLPQSATGLAWSDNRTNTATNSDDESFTVQTINKLFFTPQFADENKHRLTALLGVNTYDRQSYSYSAVSTNLASPDLQDPSIPSRIYPSGSISSSAGQQRTLSTYLNMSYTFLDRYIVFGNLNVNGDSRFGKNYRFGLFPALSGRYRISGEKFMRDIAWINDLSLRASYGITGGAPKKDYLFFNNYQAYSYNYMGENATYPEKLELRELRWEREYQRNLGLTFLAFDNKLNMEAEYWVRRKENQFMNDIVIPSISGFRTMNLNYGTVEGAGWEVSVNYTPVKTKELTVNLAFNVARSENRILEISEYASLYSGNWNENGSFLSRVELNQPTGAIYGYKYDGVYL